MPFYQGHSHTHTGGNCFLKQLACDPVAIVITKMYAQNLGKQERRQAVHGAAF